MDISLGGIADLASGQDNAFLKEGLGRINSAVEHAMAGFSVSDPEKIAPLLAEGLKETNALSRKLRPARSPIRPNMT